MSNIKKIEVDFLISGLLMLRFMPKFNPIRMLLLMLYAQTIIVSAFNKRTLQNAHDFLVKNIENVTWEINESGFLRTKFPAEILSLSYSVLSELNGTKVNVRTNFWYNKLEDRSMNLVDAAAHDHPNGFMTYVINNGYTHAIYDIHFANASATECPLNSSQLSNCTNLSIFDKKSKKLFFGGTVELIPSAIHCSNAGDIAIFDDRAIHKILQYRENTLTLNVVRQDGKFKTNIYVFHDDKSEAKSTRVVLSGKKAALITEKAIKIYEEAIHRIDNVVQEKTQIARYNFHQSATISSISLQVPTK